MCVREREGEGGEEKGERGGREREVEGERGKGREEKGEKKRERRVEW